MRKLTQKMVQVLDSKLASNGAAQQAIKNKDARSIMMFAG